MSTRRATIARSHSRHSIRSCIRRATCQRGQLPDAQYRNRYPFAGAAPGAALPAHAIEAPTLDALAQAAGIDGRGLKQTVERFNAMIGRGRDDAFRRGEAAYDRYYGDPTAEHPNLGSIEQAPFFAMPVQPGAVGTKGGARTDQHARVLDWQDRPLGGLWGRGQCHGIDHRSRHYRSWVDPGACAHVGLHRR